MVEGSMTRENSTISQLWRKAAARGSSKERKLVATTASKLPPTTMVKVGE